MEEEEEGPFEEMLKRCAQAIKEKNTAETALQAARLTNQDVRAL